MPLQDNIVFSVREVFQTRPGSRKYRIPDYQRGYKWTEANVLALLNDINGFEQANASQFYCLQNITITKIEGENYYNVIDGQQRLTTLFILLSYLGYSDIVSGKLEYAIRENTELFLQSDVLNRKCWQENYKPKPKHQDEYYILKAAGVIKSWFEPEGRTKEQIENLKTAFSKKLLENTKLIVNEVAGNEHQTFSNLNGVKVPLDAADLIRAMLITYSVKEGKENVNIDPYRARMGAEIDSIDRQWSNEDLRRYFIQFLPDRLYRSSKQLRFDTSEHPINLLYLLFLLSKRDSLETISLDAFEQYLKAGGKTFDAIKDFHNDLMDWYTDVCLYHYVGFLFFNYKDQSVDSFGKVSFKEVYQLWKDNYSKTTFLEQIKKIITSLLLPKLTKEEAANGDTPEGNLIKSIGFNFDTNWYESPKLPPILILNDIILAERSKSLSRIPPAFLRVNDEDREHISCQTPGKEDLENKDRWLEDIKRLKEFKVPAEKKDAFLLNIKRLEDKINNAEKITEDVKQEIISTLTQFGLNSIGNIVLLNGSVNKGYHNSQFFDKRKAILNNYFNEKPESNRSTSSKNKYIRPFTLRTFLLNLNGGDNETEKNGWTLEDIQRNATQIASVMSEFIRGGRFNG